MGKLFTREDGVFLARWLRHPLTTASVTPSGAALARLMAAQVDLDRPGIVVEVGGGTGPITEALLTAGVARDRLVVVERDKVLAGVLRTRFPDVTLIRDDARNMRARLREIGIASAHSVVSSLPLLSMPEQVQKAILDEAQGLLDGKGKFIQFTYSPNSPISRRKLAEWGWRAQAMGTAWLNLPPASVWVFSKLAR